MTPAEAADLSRASIAAERPPPPSTAPLPDPPSGATLRKALPVPGSRHGPVGGPAQPPRISSLGGGSFDLVVLDEGGHDFGPYAQLF